MKVRAIVLGALVLMILSVGQVFAVGKVSGYLFGDYAYAAKSNNVDFDGKSGFVVRRIYLTFDDKIDEKFSARVRLELSQKDFSHSSSKMTPVAKDAYLKWKFNNKTLYIGLSGTPTWGAVEKFWGYRWLEKTPLDLHKYGSSRDIGLALKGSLDKEKKINYHIMVAHGASNSSESDKGKKVYGALLFKPSKKAVFEIYGDFEDSEGDKPNSSNYVLQGFAGFKGDFGRLGFQAAYHSKETNADTNITQNIISGFLVAKLNKTSNAVFRIDYLTKPNPSAAKIAYIPMVNSTENLLFGILGVEFIPTKNVHFQPNIEFVVYGDDISGDTKPDNEIIPRVSIFYKF